jgi:UDP-N-acetylglucosamine enolpyruvyl transferase
VTLENVPDIADVASMLECAKRFGAEIRRKPSAGTVEIRAAKLKTARLDSGLAAKIRTSGASRGFVTEAEIEEMLLWN